MNMSSHDLIRGLIAGLAIGIPALFIGFWAKRRRAKENAETSSILRGRRS
jgi:hypothetical protein